MWLVHAPDRRTVLRRSKLVLEGKGGSPQRMHSCTCWTKCLN